MYIQYTYMIYYVSCMGITVRNLFISQTSQRIGFLHDIWGMAFIPETLLSVRSETVDFMQHCDGGLFFETLWYHLYGWITTTFTRGQQGVSCKTNRKWNMTWETKNIITAIVYDIWQMMWTSQLGAIPIFWTNMRHPFVNYSNVPR